MKTATTNKASSAARGVTGATFADRLSELKGDESYHELARKMQDAGLKVTAQGLHKWTHGGGISADNLTDLARFFDVTPAYLYFGEFTEARKVDSGLSPEARVLAEAWSLLPERFAAPLAVDTFKLFEALIAKDQHRALHVEVKQALERLTKGR